MRKSHCQPARPQARSLYRSTLPETSPPNALESGEAIMKQATALARSRAGNQ